LQKLIPLAILQVETNSPEAEPNFEKKKSSPLCWVLPLLLSSFVAYLFTFFILSSMGSSIHSHLKALPLPLVTVSSLLLNFSTVGIGFIFSTFLPTLLKQAYMFALTIIVVA